MSSGAHKHYHDEAFNPKNFVDTHFCDESFPLIAENLGFPIEQLHKDIEAGHLKGEILLDFSVGATASHLLPTCRVFPKIYVVEFTDANICEFKKWLNKEPGSCSFSYGAKLVSKLEGNSESWELKEDKARRAVQDVVKWDDYKVLLDLQRADCILSLYALNVISKTKTEFESNLKKLALLVKIGGRFCLFSGLNMTFYMVDGHKFFILQTDENYVKQAVTNAGFVIEKVILLPSKKKCNLVDFDSIMYLMARKERDI